MSVAVSPGRILDVTAPDDGGFELSIHASVPFPELTLDNGTTSVAELEVTLVNVSTMAEVRGRVTSLAGDGRKDPACADEEFEDRSDVLLGALSTTVDGATTLRFHVEAPRCARLVLEAGPPRGTEAIRVAVIGALDGDPDYLQAATDASTAAQADFVCFLGNVTFADDADPYDSFLEHVYALDVPFGVTIGPRDVRDAPAAFASTFGPADLLASFGEVRFLTLDTAQARLSDEQMAFVDAIPRSRPPGFVASHESIIGFDTSDGLRSDHQAGRLLAALGERGFAHAFAGGGPRPDRTRIAGVDLHDLGRGGPDSDDRELAVVTIRRPWPALNPCVASTDCDDFELCDRGFCRAPCADDDACDNGEACAPTGWCGVTCEADDECPGPAPFCPADGFCALDPEIAVERVRF